MDKPAGLGKAHLRVARPTLVRQPGRRDIAWAGGLTRRSRRGMLEGGGAKAKRSPAVFRGLRGFFLVLVRAHE